MTIITDSLDINHQQKMHFRRYTLLLNQIIDILADFKRDYTKKFNFSKLSRYLNIPNPEIDNIVSLLLNFQEKFENVFINYHLKKKIQDNQIYLTVEKREKKKEAEHEIPDTILITTSQLRLFNDIIYSFKFIKRGKGFNMSKNGTDLLNNLKRLKSEHPYLFELKENGLIYPSVLGLKLGELIISYNKSNKKIEKVVVERHTFVVTKNE